MLAPASPACPAEGDGSKGSAASSHSTGDGVPVRAHFNASSAVEMGTISRAALTFSGTSSRRSEEHTSELQSRENLVCRHLLVKKHNHVTSATITSIAQHL